VRDVEAEEHEGPTVVVARHAHVAWLGPIQNRMADPSREQDALDDEHGRRTALEIVDRARSQSLLLPDCP